MDNNKPEKSKTTRQSYKTIEAKLTAICNDPYCAIVSYNDIFLSFSYLRLQKSLSHIQFLKEKTIDTDMIKILEDIADSMETTHYMYGIILNKLEKY